MRNHEILNVVYMSSGGCYIVDFPGLEGPFDGFTALMDEFDRYAKASENTFEVEYDNKLNGINGFPGLDGRIQFNERIHEHNCRVLRNRNEMD